MKESIQTVSDAQLQAEKVKKTGAKVHKLIVGDKVAYLKHPSRTIMGLALTKQNQGDTIGMSEVLLDNCWISGDDQIKTDDDYFYNAMSQLQNLVEVKSSSLEKF